MQPPFRAMLLHPEKSSPSKVGWEMHLQQKHQLSTRVIIGQHKSTNSQTIHINLYKSRNTYQTITNSPKKNVHQCWIILPCNSLIPSQFVHQLSIIFPYYHSFPYVFHMFSICFSIVFHMCSIGFPYVFHRFP